MTTRPRTGFVYTLTDPRDGTIRYVGKTSGQLLTRLAQHLASPTNPAMRVWLNALSLQGLTPEITAVRTVPIDALSAEEERQITAHAQRGHRLLNSPYYHQHLADLIGVRAALRPAAGPSIEQRNRLAAFLYGRLASRRASGRISKLAAAAYVIITGPVYLAGATAMASWRSRTVRVTVFTAMAVGYLMDVGFDRLAHDYVTPYLHLPELALFWRHYLAEPLRTIGEHLLVLSPVISGAAYKTIADAAGVGKPVPTKMPTQRKTPDPTTLDTAARAAAALDAALPKRPS
ncbi:hypothetical protein [Streptomyces sp. NBC_00233]|uniref:hypothetical protein n=1 Tax=Streptomyces sp. NBC_00233 TaxID=2975686 RepID=UPI0022577AE9|nr:hypothetical protein [Streptomyces sp. NBC_00233]MCX5229689.1 hypothetical protein [Streptomyces sp. NBC_00233]